MAEWDDPLSPDERDAAIERIARAVTARRLDLPATLLLEVHRPLSFIASQGLVVFSPFTAPIIGLENVQLASRLLRDRENVDRLIARIEELAAQRQNPKPTAGEPAA